MCSSYMHILVCVCVCVCITERDPCLHTLSLLSQLTAPAAPREVNATNLSSTEISVTWLQPDPTNGVIQQYIVTYYPSGSPGDNTTNSTSDTSITIGGLSAFTEYSVFVVAVTVAPGPASTAVNVTTSEAGVWVCVGGCVCVCEVGGGSVCVFV